jgi:hypothetical protein
VWIGTAAALIGSIRSWFAKPEKPFASVVLPLTVLLCFVGGLVVKAAYVQYLVLWFPLASVVAADVLIAWGTGPMTRPVRRTLFCVLLALLAFEVLVAARAMGRGADGALPHLTARLSSVHAAIGYFALLLVLTAIAGACLWRGHRPGAVLVLALLGFGYAGLRNLDALGWSNRDQVAAIQHVHRLVIDGETVFDGYTGFGVFQHHAYYYWWINPYSLALMTPSQRGPALLGQLERSPPKIVCLDENVRLLPPDVVRWIERHYVPIDPPLYERKDSAPLRP